MPKKVFRALMAGAVALLLAGQAEAQEKLIDGSDVDVIMNHAHGWGTAELESDNSGDPMISGRMEGLLYAIFFYGCVKHQNCNSIQFYASWTDSVLDNVKINEWNSSRRWPTALRTDAGSVAVKMNVNLDGGTSPENLEDWFSWWSIGLKTFDEYVNGD